MILRSLNQLVHVLSIDAEACNLLQVVTDDTARGAALLFWVDNICILTAWSHIDRLRIAHVSPAVVAYGKVGECFERCLFVPLLRGIDMCGCVEYRICLETRHLHLAVLLIFDDFVFSNVIWGKSFARLLICLYRLGAIWSRYKKHKPHNDGEDYQCDRCSLTADMLHKPMPPIPITQPLRLLDSIIGSTVAEWLSEGYSLRAYARKTCCESYFERRAHSWFSRHRCFCSLSCRCS